MTASQAPSLRSRAAHAGKWGAAEIIVRHGFQALGMILLARILAPGEFGMMALVLVFTTVCALLVEAGFGAALIQRQSTTPDDETSAFAVNLGLSVLLATLLWLAAPLIARMFGLAELSALVRMMCLLLPVTALGSVPDALLAQKMRFRERTVVEAIGGGVGVAAGLWVALRGGGVWALVAQAMATALARTVGLWALSRWIPTGRVCRSAVTSLWRYGGYLLAANVSDVLFNRLQAALIGHQFGIRDLGHFTMAQNVQQLPTTLVASFLNRVGFPFLSSIRNDSAVLLDGLRQAVRSSLFLFVPFMVVIAVHSDGVVRLAFGPGWEASAPVLAVLAFAATLWPWLVLTIVGLNATGQTREVLRLEMVKKPFALAAVLVALPLGLVAVACALLVAAMFAAVLQGFRCRTRLGYRLSRQCADVLPILALALLAAAAAHALRGILATGLATELLGLPVFAAVYLGLAWLFRLKAGVELMALWRAEQPAGATVASPSASETGKTARPD